MSYHWLFLMYLNLASPPQQRQPAHKLPLPGWVKAGEHRQKVAKKQPSMTPPQPQPLTLSQPHTQKSLHRPQMIVYSIPISSGTSGY